MLQKRPAPKKPAESKPAEPKSQPEPKPQPKAEPKSEPKAAVRPAPEPDPSLAATAPMKKPKPAPAPKPVKAAPPAYVNQKPPSQMITNYRKRQQIGPFIIWSLVALLIVGGVIILVVWAFSQNGPVATIMATETPTLTATATATSTNTSTATATETLTPTITLTPTPSAPFYYEIQSGDTLYGLQEKFGLPDDFLCTIAALNAGLDINNISLGQKILLPDPNTRCPTATPIDFSTVKRGQEMQYTIQAGDTIAAIASTYNSTVEDILAKNKIDDVNKIFVGQVIIVRANLVTPTITPNPTLPPEAITATAAANLALTPGSPTAPVVETPTLTPTP